MIRNNILLGREDSIRQSYISSWMQNVSAGDIASSTGIAKERITKALGTSMGNYHAIASFLSGAGDKADLAIRLLENVTDKDLRDTPEDVLDDHLAHAPEKPAMMDEQFYDMWILSPRVDNELLTSFRSALKKIPEELYGSFTARPESIASWIDTAITVTETENYYGTPVIPAGVLRLSDSRHTFTRHIFCGTLPDCGARVATGTGNRKTPVL